MVTVTVIFLLFFILFYLHLPVFLTSTSNHAHLFTPAFITNTQNWGFLASTEKRKTPLF